MITTSGLLIKKLVRSSNEIFSPISRVEYYDTPFSTNSWGFKAIYYDNDWEGTREFDDRKITFVGRDSLLSHSWGEGGPAQIPGGHNFLARWLGYFRADFTGIYKFYLSVDDGGRFYIGTDSDRGTLLPSGLGTAQLLTLSPTNLSSESVGSFDSWSARNNIATFSGWVDLTEGEWYPIKIDYFSETNTSTRYSNIVARYEEPSDVTNSEGIPSDTGIRKVLSAGVVNYPYSEDSWANALEANMIGEDTPNHYVELQNVIEIRTDRRIGSIGTCSIKLPFSADTYHPVKSLKDTYVYGGKHVMIKPGRLIDVSAGFQTKCLHFNSPTRTCNLNVDPVHLGGYFQPNLCENVNSRCPFQQAMPGDYVKRFRGKITSIEINRESDKSFLILKCEDNLFYLRKAINQNYPDATSYASFDYEGKSTTNVTPDGIGMPTAYDSFRLDEAFKDMCIKAGIDSTYIHTNQLIVVSGGGNDVQYIIGGKTVEGSNTRLSRTKKYGNALYAGLTSDLEADTPYIWKQDFGNPLLDQVNAMADNYGYMIGCDVDGNMILKTRDNPIFYPASGLNRPSNWHRIPDLRSFSGHYIWASGVTGHAKIPLQGSQFSIYFASESHPVYWAWDIMRNEGLVTSGYNHGEYSPQEIDEEFASLGYGIGVGAGAVLNKYWLWDFQNSEPQVYVILPQELWVMLRPKYQFSIDRIQFKYKGFDNSITIPGLEDWTTEVKADVHIGTVTIADDITAPNPKEHVDISFASSTQIASDVNIDDLFIPDPYDRWNEKVIPTSTFALTSGVEYAIKITPKLYVNGQEWTVNKHVVELIQNPTFRNFLKYKFPWTRQCTLGGVKIDTDATPSPVDYRYIYTSNQPNSIADTTWDHTNFEWDRNFYYNNRTVFPDFVVLNSTIGADGIGEGLHVMVNDTNSNTIYQARNIGFTRLPEGVTDYRFSTDGIDPGLNYNPNIWTHYSSKWVSPIPEMGSLIPEGNSFTLLISGKNLRLEGIAVSKQTSTSPKFRFSTIKNITSMNIDTVTDDVRNDVIVVGNLKGPLVDPNTNKIVNPNNPTFDYIYSRSVDLSSQGRLGVENSVGMSIPFLVYEPNIQTQEHADYLSFAILDRYRKFQNLVSWRGLAIPFLDLEDAVMVTDDRYVSSTNNQIQWIEGISETITSDDYTMDLDTTPLAPWPSYIPKPPPDINDFAHGGKPQLIINVSMTDNLGIGRNDALLAPHDINYDPYESEGASANSSSANGYPPIVLRCKFTLMTNAEIRISVRSVDNPSIPSNSVIAWLLGNEDEQGNQIWETRDWGTYEVEWDGVDLLGNSRTPAQAAQEGIRVGNDLSGIYARNGRYYLLFEVNSLYPDDHIVHGASHEYSTKNLPTIGDSELPLNPQNTSLGEGTGDVLAQYWKLEIGEPTKAEITGNATPPRSLRESSFPGGSLTATFIKGKQFTSINDNLEVWLDAESGSPAYMKNRDVRFEAKVEEGSCFVLPIEEKLQYDDGTGLDDYNVPTLQHVLVSSPGEEASTELIPPNAFSADSGVTAGGDEWNFNYPIFMKNRDRGEIPGVPGLNRMDHYIKLSELETKVTFNPMRYGLFFNQVDKSSYESLYDEAEGLYRFITTSPGVHELLVLGFKIIELVYMARWINVYFKALDRSGRPVKSDTIWNDSLGRGYQQIGSGAPREGWLAYRCIWIPHGSADMSFGQVSHPYMTSYVSPSWTNASDVNNSTVKRLSITGYTGLNDAELPTGTSISHHTLFCMHAESPHGAMGDMKNNDDLTYFRNNFTVYGFYAWPIWVFWKPVTTGQKNNYSIRTRFPEDASAGDFMGSPPWETIRGEG